MEALYYIKECKLISGRNYKIVCSSYQPPFRKTNQAIMVRGYDWEGFKLDIPIYLEMELDLIFIGESDRNLVGDSFFLNHVRRTDVVFLRRLQHNVNVVSFRGYTKSIFSNTEDTEKYQEYNCRGKMKLNESEIRDIIEYNTKLLNRK